MVSKFTFFTDSVSIKTRIDDDGEKQHYIEGYVSTSHIDLGNDIVTKEAMEDMVLQIKNSNIKLDIEHEAPKKSLNIIPVGRILDARVDEKGLWVKAIINKHSSRFQEVWMSIKNGFIDAFSIAYQVIKTKSKYIDGKAVRILDQVKLVNIALTGNPMNPECKIGAVMTKSLENIESEEEQMAEDAEIKHVEPEQEAPAQEIAVKENPLAAEIKSLQEQLESMVAEVKSLKGANEEDKKAFVALKERLDAAEKVLEKPQLKSDVQTDVPEVVEAEVIKSPLQMIV